MPRAVIDPSLCRPEACDSGICPARKSCPAKAIWQPERGETPFLDPGRCHGCAKCLAVCKPKAIRLA